MERERKTSPLGLVCRGVDGICVVLGEETRDQDFAEASTGFEPVIRVLQTLAFPLGHDAVLADSRWQIANGFRLTIRYLPSAIGYLLT